MFSSFLCTAANFRSFLPILLFVAPEYAVGRLVLDAESFPAHFYQTKQQLEFLIRVKEKPGLLTSEVLSLAVENNRQRK